MSFRRCRLFLCVWWFVAFVFWMLCSTQSSNRHLRKDHEKKRLEVFSSMSIAALRLAGLSLSAFDCMEALRVCRSISCFGSFVMCFLRGLLRLCWLPLCVRCVCRIRKVISFFLVRAFVQNSSALSQIEGKVVAAYLHPYRVSRRIDAAYCSR